MSRPLLSNEERLRRQRERWARQAAQRRAETADLKAFAEKSRKNRGRCGVSDRREKIITPAQMKLGEAYFWGNRGLCSMPATTAGILA